jgi:hypothetical protein
MASIENAQVAGDISGYDKLLQDALKNNGYKSGFVDADMLDGAVEDVKKSADWKKMIDQIQAANDTRQVRIDTSDRRRRDLETQMSSRRRAAYEKINNDYTAGKDKAEKDYDLQRVAVENTYHDRVHNRINTKGNEVEVKRFEGEYEAKIKLDKAIADLEQKLAREVADIDTDATLSAEVKAQRVAAAEERTERDRKDARTAYNEEVSRVQPATAQAKPLGFLSDYLPYAHPNWVSQAAAKEASQNTARAKNAVRQLENGEDITSFEKSRFISTDDDQNETQGKFFSLLADNDKAITQAVSSLQKVIETLDDRGKLEDKQINSIVGLAKGVAAQINAGKDVSKFESIIKLINQINSDSRVDKKSVEDYATDMKPKTS